VSSAVAGSRRVAAEGSPPAAGAAHFSQHLGFAVERSEPGHVWLRLPVLRHLRNRSGRGVHGGVLAGCVDSAVAAALHSLYDDDPTVAGWSTLELNISYLAPAAGSEVTAEARVIRAGRSIVVGEVTIFAVDGTPAAAGRASYRLWRDG